MEYRRKELTVDIISASRNRKLELKSVFKDSKIGVGLSLKEKLNKNKMNNLYNYNFYKKRKP